MESAAKRSEIKNRYTRNVIFSGEHSNMRETVEAAVKAGVSLAEADLSEVDLYGANLQGADLYGANLQRANLRYVLLRETDLTDTDLSQTKILPNMTQAEYMEQLPELLQAGGKTIEEVAQHWDCHNWENCPMACAFGVHSASELPEEWQERADEFVRLFDAGLLPKPV